MAHQRFIFLKAVVNWGAQKDHEECLEPCGKWKCYSFIQKVWDGVFILWLRSKTCFFFFSNDLASITKSNFIFAVNWRKGDCIRKTAFDWLWANLCYMHVVCECDLTPNGIIFCQFLSQICIAFSEETSKDSFSFIMVKQPFEENLAKSGHTYQHLLSI